MKILMKTSKGDIHLELDEKAAPVSVANFCTYAAEGHYDGTIFHRVIPGFMIQGGGFTPDMRQKTAKQPIRNEWRNGLKNKRGTIAMARLGGNPDSATCQFFINVKDNASSTRHNPTGRPMPSSDRSPRAWRSSTPSSRSPPSRTDTTATCRSTPS